uniref:Coiled-coil domain containing 191 n=1 Tax=Varanus komodoensis TaxID=61221 RepID=A0A8D2LRX5_VARKO
FSSYVYNVLRQKRARVEQASEFAVSEAFSSKKTSYPRGFHGPVLDLETTEQLLDHDGAYVEAQELLSEWMNSKLKLELASDPEDIAENTAACCNLQEPPMNFQKYDNFDELYGYLEQEMESTTVQDFLQHLLQSEVVKSGILENLKTEDRKEKRKSRDPRITMELRHKQVKENRLRRQKELEHLKQEKALKKSLMSEAHKQLQEENKKKLLKAKREDKEIQKLMVKLRKEFVERRQRIENAQKIKRLVEVNLSPAMSAHLDCEIEEQRKAKETNLQDLLGKIDIANRKCLQKYFSAWYKLILDLRIKMGKARALADWKCQLKTLRAWRDYTWSRKLEQEMQRNENQLWDQNRKKQMATSFNRKCILRHYFTEWQCWSRTEIEKRELQMKKEETRRKMANLLEELVLGKFAPHSSWDNKKIHETEEAQNLSVSFLLPFQMTVTPYLQDDSTTVKVERTNSYSLEDNQKFDVQSVKKPKWAWQVTLKHAALNAEDHAMFCNQKRSSSQCLGTSRQKTASAFWGPMEHRYAFQQQLIEEQRQQIQEQQELILQLQENEKLKKVREEAEQATAVTRTLNNVAPKSRIEKSLRENPLNYKNSEPLRRMEREQQLLSKAKEHYTKVLLKKQGLDPWKRLIKQSQENMVMAQRHHCFGLQRKCLLAWLHHVQEILDGKIAQAENLYSCLLLRRSFGIWRKYLYYISTLEEIASKHQETSLKKKVFWAWFDVLNEEKSALWRKQQVADQYSDRRIVLIAFRAWQQFPALMEEERKREERLAQLRRIVTEILDKGSDMLHSQIVNMWRLSCRS